MGKDLERFRVAERRVRERLGVTPVDRRVPLSSGGDVRVQELGEGRPVVLVFIHGAPIAGTSWADLATCLHDVRCILVDRPGCGLSDPAASAPFTARLATVPGMQALVTRIPMTRRMVRAVPRRFGLGRAIDSGAFDDIMLDGAHALSRHTDTMRNDVRSSPQVITPIRGQNPDVLLTDELLSRQRRSYISWISTSSSVAVSVGWLSVSRRG